MRYAGKLGLTVALIGVSGIALSGCIKTEKEKCIDNGGKPLTMADAKKTFPGNTLSGVIKSTSMQIPYDVFLSEDGRSTGTAMTDSDRGVWRITDKGELCITWNTWQDGKENCSTYYHEGNEYKVFVEQGGLAAVAKVVSGNPKNLSLKTDKELALEKNEIVAITSDEAKTELNGNTFAGDLKPAGNSPYIAFFDPAGKVAARISGAVVDDDKGQWSINANGEICTKWNKWNDAKEQCAVYYRQGKKIVVYSAKGMLMLSGKVKKGNPENIAL